ncbi:MAG: hypothetical protein ABJP45_14090 [Cyclobacteriaceae bacterium]
MKYIKKAMKFVGYLLAITLLSVGLGFSGAIFPVYKRKDDNEDKIEMVEFNAKDPGKLEG